MTETEAAYMAEALAEGKHMTERRVNDMIYVPEAGLVAEYLNLEPSHGGERERVMRAPNNADGEERWQIVTDTAYIETLEQTVLELWRSWEPKASGVGSNWWCRPCSGPVTDKINEVEHAPDCIVPALISKYEDADGR